jgi:hypothetical protein
MIVQVFPVPTLSTVVLVQVPPVTVNVPFPLPLILATVGEALNANGAALAPVAVLVTVIVPVFVPVPPVFSAGLGVLKVTVAPVTLKGTVCVEVPFGVVTVTFLVVVSEAPLVTAQLAVTWILEVATTLVQVMPPPLMATAVAPVMLVPARVTGTVVPRTPVLGVIDVSVGGGGAVTVNVRGLLVAPPASVTVTFLAFAVAVAAMFSVAVTVVSFTAVKPLTVMFIPDTFTAVAPVRPRPVMVTGTAAPRTPVLGAIEVSPIPVPLIVTTAGLAGSLEATLSVPACGPPTAVGANRTL